jgi:NAD(P)-dependent dehydrogenase (short-subunit alcohol dehydrogenase family)
MIDLGLRGKRAVVSGAGYIPTRAGHGRFSALTLADAGALVACVDIDQRRAQDIVDEIEGTGGVAVPVIADMTERAEVRRALDEVVDRLGGIDVCVDIIGGARWNAVEEFDDDDWNWTIQNNLTQVFYLFQEIGRRMIAQGTGGSMVAVASVDGIAAAGFHVAYGAAKAGVISLTKTFADELGRYGIRVNSVAPGNVGSGNEDLPEREWGTNPVNPLAPPRAHDVGNAVLFLSSALASRITGQTLIVDGGTTTRSLWGMTAEVVPYFRQF